MNELEARERQRRRALWELERLQPGSDQAKPHLAILDDIERRDREEPIGEAWAMSIDELKERVPETEILGRDGHNFIVVLDEHIPEPWKNRFVEASTGSTRLRQGCYASDWRRFLRLWAREMKHLEAHRDMALANALSTKQREQWLAENREAMNAYNEHVEAQGVFGDNVRSL